MIRKQRSVVCRHYRSVLTELILLCMVRPRRQTMAPFRLTLSSSPPSISLLAPFALQQLGSFLQTGGRYYNFKL